MFKKALVVLALVVSTTGASYSQTAGQSVMGFLLNQGSTYGTYTCPSTATSPCFVQYGSSVPTASGAGGTTVSIDQTTQGTTNGVVTKTGSVTNTTPAQRTLVTLDVKSVTTGGTPVTALTAGHRTAGGFLFNPSNATTPLCVNEIGTAIGTTSSGDTTCVQPGQKYTLTPSAGAVSVVTSDSSHPFSGYGFN